MEAGDCGGVPGRTMKTLSGDKGLGTGSALVENESELVPSVYHCMSAFSNMENSE